MQNALNKWDRRFLEMAALVAGWSKDPSSKVGACVVDAQKRIVSLGFNGSPRGVYDVGERTTRLLRTIHAEANCLHFASRSIEGCTMYVTHPPCANCAGHIIQRGIARVVFPLGSPEFMERWRGNYHEALSMFGEAGVRIDIVDNCLWEN